MKTRLRRDSIENMLDMLFAYYLLATPGSMKEQVLKSAIESWQKELEVWL